MPLRSTQLVTSFLMPLVCCWSQTAFPSKCTDGSSLPFASIQASHTIDSACPELTGDPSAADRSHLQNTVKNDFCRGPVSSEHYDIARLIKLQGDVVDKHISFGFKQEPSDRDGLRELGEGTVIRIKASLIEAHHADLGSGESVNCYQPTEDDNDIHIALGDTTATDECESISAEISPHYRPASWNEIGHFETKKGKNYIVNPAIASRLQSETYRITGQLFFDASHKPCTCGAVQCNGNPTRASNWEIHPVYNIEVCKSGTACDENIDDQWVAFDTWWQHLPPVHLPPPHSHGTHEPSKKKK